jgi:hypothetical protein
MLEPRVIYRSDGEWVAVLFEDNLFDTTGDWIGWLDGRDVYTLGGEYAGYISRDGRLLRRRVLPYVKRRRVPEREPAYKHPKSVPLPPLFAELGYETVDVFEYDPNVFVHISDLRPDAGESRLTSLTRVDPRLEARQELARVSQDILEEMVYGMVCSYGAKEPPLRVEAMAAGLPPDKTGDVALASAEERLELARQLIERVGLSPWAVERGYCGAEGFQPSQIEYAARALLMPRQWILDIPARLRRSWAIAHRFRVPEQIATLRLHDLE